MSMVNDRSDLGVETDFVQNDDWCIELVRNLSYRLALLKFDIKTWNISYDTRIEVEDQVFVPLEEDELTRHVRLAYFCGDYGSVRGLFQKIDSVLSLCLDLDERHRFLLACFVLSTWLVDRLPIAPMIAIVGPSQSGKTTAVNALHLLCRRGLVTSDISSAAFYRHCDRLMPTLFIDNIAATGQERQLLRLLRSGNNPDIMGFPGSQSYRTYGPKVVSWMELPDDDALNSRFIIIPMQETSRTDLLRTTDPEIIALGGKLQARLLNYRFRNFSKLQLTQIAGAKNLRPRQRDLCEALAFPIADDPEACARLLECMGQQNDLHNPSLPPNQAAVLETLFQMVHPQPEQGTLTFSGLTEKVNLNLERSGERFRLNAKGIGTALKSLGLFSARKRVSSGYMGYLDRNVLKRIHDLVSRHGMDFLFDGLPSEKSGEPCDFCKARNAQSPEVPPSIETQKDPPQSHVQPDLGVAQASHETEDIGSSRGFETEGDRELRDRSTEDYEDEGL
jgi:hypothetical protein